MQTDPTDMTTDCYVATDAMVMKMFDIYNAGTNLFSSGNYDFLAPVTQAEEFLVEVNDYLNACHVLGLVLQFDSRFTIPGACDLLFTTIYGYFGNAALKTMGFDLTNTAYGTSCAALGTNIGYITSNIFAYHFPNEYVLFGIAQNSA